MNGPPPPLSREEALPALPSTPRPVNTVLGLSQAEAARRLASTAGTRFSASRRVAVGGAAGAVPLADDRLLLGACGVSAVLGEVADAIAIGAIVVLNALVGFLQESGRAGAAGAARDDRAAGARDAGRHAVRDPAAEVVPGDVLLLEAGDVVAADARLLEAHALATNEAALTGESVPVEKAARAVAADAPLASARPVFMGTSVTSGTGLGRGAGHRHAHRARQDRAPARDRDRRAQTPLQRRLARVSRTLLLCVPGASSVLVALLGLLRGHAAARGASCPRCRSRWRRCPRACRRW